MTETAPTAPRRHAAAARWIGHSPVLVWGSTPVDRLRRSLARAGVWDAAPWTGRPPAGGDTVLMLRGDHVYDDALIAALVRGAPVAVVRGDGQPTAALVGREQAAAMAAVLDGNGTMPAGLPLRRGRQLVAAAELARRRGSGPLVMPVTPETRRTVEDRLFDQASPAIADAVSLAVWPTPARALARLVVGLNLSPGHVTALNLLLAALTALLLHAGWLGTGLTVAWLTSLVDAVDGRLARLTLSFSQVRAGVGHAVALLHPPLWWWGWWSGDGGDALPMLILVAGSILLPAGEALFRWRAGFALHEWRRFDSVFRLVAAGRNMLLVPLTLGLIAGMPAMGFWAAAGWQGLTLMVQALRLGQARRTPPESWLCREDWKAPDPAPM